MDNHYQSPNNNHPMNTPETLTNQYLSQLNNSSYEQQNYLHQINNELKRTNSKLTGIIVILLIPYIVGFIATVISILTGYGILQMLFY